jgi:hypothetical protein
VDLGCGRLRDGRWMCRLSSWLMDVAEALVDGVELL